MKFNETTEQEALLNKLIIGGKGWPTHQGGKINFLGFGDVYITREQFEARDGWIVWRGGECPVPRGVRYEFMTETGRGVTDRVIDSRWEHRTDSSDNVLLYRIIKSKPQGHPHAELMAKYAEDAKTSAEPWKLWEIHDICTGWIGLKTEFSFHAQAKYRRKPKTKLIHGVEVPDISYTPENGELYVHCDPSHCNLYTVQYECSSGNDRHMVEQGLAYPNTEEGKKAAILHAKAMLGINDD